jgi:hypothetical protein
MIEMNKLPVYLSVVILCCLSVKAGGGGGGGANYWGCARRGLQLFLWILRLSRHASQKYGVGAAYPCEELVGTLLQHAYIAYLTGGRWVREGSLLLGSIQSYCLSALPPDVGGRGQPAPVRSWLVEGGGGYSPTAWVPCLPEVH